MHAVHALADPSALHRSPQLEQVHVLLFVNNQLYIEWMHMQIEGTLDPVLAFVACNVHKMSRSSRSPMAQMAASIPEEAFKEPTRRKTTKKHLQPSARV
jgi:hypothetical protein